MTVPSRPSEGEFEPGFGRHLSTIVYHIPVCPFSQRIEILLTLKGCMDQVAFHVIDITQPRPDWLMQKSRGVTALPILETRQQKIIRESMIILRYFEEQYPRHPVAQLDPYRRSIERMAAGMANQFCNQGYAFVMNQDAAQREILRGEMLRQYELLNEFLLVHSPDGIYLFDDFGWAEVVFTPLFMRFWFLGYYEDFEVPDEPRFSRVRRWCDACMQHPATQQVTREQIIKLYYDYSRGAGNGALLPGRRLSSFALQPDWRDRPWPPQGKGGPIASDSDLGLCT